MQAVRVVAVEVVTVVVAAVVVVVGAVVLNTVVVVVVDKAISKDSIRSVLTKARGIVEVRKVAEEAPLTPVSQPSVQHFPSGQF